MTEVDKAGFLVSSMRGFLAQGKKSISFDAATAEFICHSLIRYYQLEKDGKLAKNVIPISMDVFIEARNRNPVNPKK